MEQPKKRSPWKIEWKKVAGSTWWATRSWEGYARVHTGRRKCWRGFWVIDQGGDTQIHGQAKNVKEAKAECERRLRLLDEALAPAINYWHG